MATLTTIVANTNQEGGPILNSPHNGENFRVTYDDTLKKILNPATSDTTIATLHNFCNGVTGLVALTYDCGFKVSDVFSVVAIIAEQEG